jgi:hypothetical protein
MIFAIHPRDKKRSSLLSVGSSRRYIFFSPHTTPLASRHCVAFSRRECRRKLFLTLPFFALFLSHRPPRIASHRAAASHRIHCTGSAHRVPIFYFSSPSRSLAPHRISSWHRIQDPCSRSSHSHSSVSPEVIPHIPLLRSLSVSSSSSHRIASSSSIASHPSHWVGSSRRYILFILSLPQPRTVSHLLMASHTGSLLTFLTLSFFALFRLFHRPPHIAPCIGTSPCVASSRHYFFLLSSLPHRVIASHPGIASRLVAWHTGFLAARRDRFASHRIAWNRLLDPPYRVTSHLILLHPRTASHHVAWHKGSLASLRMTYRIRPCIASHLRIASHHILHLVAPHRMTLPRIIA